MSKKGLFALAVLFFLAGSAGFVLASRLYFNLRDGESGSYAEPDPAYLQTPADASQEWMTDFTLTERSGREVRWSDLQGKVAVSSFFFSSCPATCLQQNQKMGEIHTGFKDQDVVFLSITCDPDTDTPERLREYANKLNADPEQWLFLTGDLTYIRRVAGEMFTVALDKQTHSENLIVSDKWGNIRGRYHWNKLDEVTELKRQVDKLLAETEEPAEFVEQKAKAAAAKQAAAVSTAADPEAAAEPKAEQGNAAASSVP